jgi:hypothetical protein
VIYERHGYVVDCQRLIQLRHALVLDRTRPPTAGLAQHSENAPQRWRKTSDQGRVEEAAAIEVVGYWPRPCRAAVIGALLPGWCHQDAAFIFRSGAQRLTDQHLAAGGVPTDVSFKSCFVKLARQANPGTPGPRLDVVARPP